MEMQVLYVDTLFLINYALDFLSLSLVGIFLHLRRRIWRLLLVSLLGASYAVLAVIFAFPTLLHIFLSVLLSLVLVLCAYRDFGNGGRLVGAVIAFYFSSVLLGGIVQVLFGWLEKLLVPRSGALFKLSDLVLIFGFAAFGLVYAASRFFGGMPLKKFATVRATFGDKNVTFAVLIDSGCLLNDPISGKPAMVVRLDTLGQILPSEIVACARSKSAYMPRDPYHARRCRLIPAEALGEKRLLLSVRADKLCVLPDKKGKEKERELDAYIALIPSAEHHFGGFEGLLPSSLLML